MINEVTFLYWGNLLFDYIDWLLPVSSSPFAEAPAGRPNKNEIASSKYGQLQLAWGWEPAGWSILCVCVLPVDLKGI